jgi:hypothetical protein
VTDGKTPELGGKSIPLALSQPTLQGGYALLSGSPIGAISMNPRVSPSKVRFTVKAYKYPWAKELLPEEPRDAHGQNHLDHFLDRGSAPEGQSVSRLCDRVRGGRCPAWTRTAAASALCLGLSGNVITKKAERTFPTSPSGRVFSRSGSKIDLAAGVWRAVTRGEKL